MFLPLFWIVACLGKTKTLFPSIEFFMVVEILETVKELCKVNTDWS